jgi:UPF0755 protein
MLHFIRTPASSEPAEVVMEVPVGTSVQALSDLLYGQGLVRSAGKFRWLVRFKGAARQIKAGEYQLSTGLRPGELLNKIIRGEVRLHQITFPEGYTLKQMAELLEASKLANAERFVAAATDPSLVRRSKLANLVLLATKWSSLLQWWKRKPRQPRNVR